MVFENIRYGTLCNSPKYTLSILLIDDGWSDRGHRNNVMLSIAKQIGVKIGPHPKHQKACVINFSTGHLEKE